MMFVELGDLSWLDEDSSGAFYTHILKMVQDAQESSHFVPIASDMCGSGLYFVFSDVIACGTFALELLAVMLDTNWEQGQVASYKHDFRIALHCGPVYEFADLLLKRQTYSGINVSKTRWLCRLAKRNSIIVSETFAACLSYFNHQFHYQHPLSFTTAKRSIGTGKHTFLLRKLMQLDPLSVPSSHRKKGVPFYLSNMCFSDEDICVSNSEWVYSLEASPAPDGLPRPHGSLVPWGEQVQKVDEVVALHDKFWGRIASLARNASAISTASSPTAQLLRLLYIHDALKDAINVTHPKNIGWNWANDTELVCAVAKNLIQHGRFDLCLSLVRKALSPSSRHNTSMQLKFMEMLCLSHGRNPDIGKLLTKLVLAIPAAPAVFNPARTAEGKETNLAYLQAHILLLAANMVSQIGEQVGDDGENTLPTIDQMYTDSFHYFPTSEAAIKGSIAHLLAGQRKQAMALAKDGFQQVAIEMSIEQPESVNEKEELKQPSDRDPMIKTFHDWTLRAKEQGKELKIRRKIGQLPEQVVIQLQEGIPGVVIRDGSVVKNSEAEHKLVRHSHFRRRIYRILEWLFRLAEASFVLGKRKYAIEWYELALAQAKLAVGMGENSVRLMVIEARATVLKINGASPLLRANDQFFEYFELGSVLVFFGTQINSEVIYSDEVNTKDKKASPHYQPSGGDFDPHYPSDVAQKSNSTSTRTMTPPKPDPAQDHTLRSGRRRRSNFSAYHSRSRSSHTSPFQWDTNSFGFKPTSSHLVYKPAAISPRKPHSLHHGAFRFSSRGAPSLSQTAPVKVDAPETSYTSPFHHTSKLPSATAPAPPLPPPPPPPMPMSPTSFTILTIPPRIVDHPLPPPPTLPKAPTVDAAIGRPEVDARMGFRRIVRSTRYGQKKEIVDIELEHRELDQTQEDRTRGLQLQLEDLEDRVKFSFGKAIRNIRPAVAYCVGLTDSDILLAGSMLEEGKEVHMFLPFDFESLDAHWSSTTSTIFPARRWHQTSAAVLSNKMCRVHVLAVDHFESSAPVLSFAKRVCKGLALLKAIELGQEATELLVMSHAGSPQDEEEMYRLETGSNPHRIVLPNPNGCPPPPSPWKLVDALDSKERRLIDFQPVIRYLLFVEVVEGEQSKTTVTADSPLPAHLLTQLVNMVLQFTHDTDSPVDGKEKSSRQASAPEYVNNLGGTILLCFEDCISAAETALAILGAKSEMSQLGFPVDSNLRLGLHAGPVRGGVDPIKGGTAVCGRQISIGLSRAPLTLQHRSAWLSAIIPTRCFPHPRTPHFAYRPPYHTVGWMIERCAMLGCCYASESFAGCVASLPSHNSFRFEYVVKLTLSFIFDRAFVFFGNI